jgi:hypothetical protein
VDLLLKSGRVQRGGIGGGCEDRVAPVDSIVTLLLGTAAVKSNTMVKCSNYRQQPYLYTPCSCAGCSETGSSKVGLISMKVLG